MLLDTPLMIQGNPPREKAFLLNTRLFTSNHRLIAKNKRTPLILRRDFFFLKQIENSSSELKKKNYSGESFFF